MNENKIKSILKYCDVTQGYQNTLVKMYLYPKKYTDVAKIAFTSQYVDHNFLQTLINCAAFWPGADFIRLYTLGQMIKHVAEHEKL